MRAAEHLKISDLSELRYVQESHCNHRKEQLQKGFQDGRCPYLRAVPSLCQQSASGKESLRRSLGWHMPGLMRFCTPCTDREAEYYLGSSWDDEV